MGSQFWVHWNDIVGVKMYITDTEHDNTYLSPTLNDATELCATLDGSGFYDCEHKGQYLVFVKE